MDVAPANGNAVMMAKACFDPQGALDLYVLTPALLLTRLRSNINNSRWSPAGGDWKRKRDEKVPLRCSPPIHRYVQNAIIIKL